MKSKGGLMNINELAKKIDAEIVQTHISWVLLDQKYAYKIKKNIKLSFLDFSSLEKRKKFCYDELSLNKRLSSIYLGVYGIDSNYNITKPSKNSTEYLIKMIRLNEYDRMDHKINEVNSVHMKKLAKMIFEFHQLEKGKKNYGKPEMIWDQAVDLSNYKEQIDKLLPDNNLEKIMQRMSIFFNLNKKLFLERVKKGKIKDCHGDLHSKNIFINEEIIPIDCIEFNQTFRIIDVINEIAFMCMDLEAMNRKDLSNDFLNEYNRLSEDDQIPLLIDFYKCYRAGVRAKISAIEGDKKNLEKYLNLADEYSKKLSK